MLAGRPQVKGDNNDVNVKRLPKKPVGCIALLDHAMLPSMAKALLASLHRYSQSDIASLSCFLAPDIGSQMVSAVNLIELPRFQCRRRSALAASSQRRRSSLRRTSALIAGGSTQPSALLWYLLTALIRQWASFDTYRMQSQCPPVHEQMPSRHPAVRMCMRTCFAGCRKPFEELRPDFRCPQCNGEFVAAGVQCSMYTMHLTYRSSCGSGLCIC
jgi:hypothetical protein